MKTSQNPEKIQEILQRRVQDVVKFSELEKLLKSGKKLRLYNGVDPSGAKLHLGHAVVLRKLKEFQDAGHEVILLIGDFTGMIGDPTDRGAARKPLTRKEVLSNAKDYQKQAARILDFKGKNPVKIKYNSKWLDKISFQDLIPLASNFTVNQFLERDMFQKRLKWRMACVHCFHVFISPRQFGTRMAYDTAIIENKETTCPNCGKNTPIIKNEMFPPEPIHLHEFLYPLMQGYDSVAMDVDLEVGGNDQLFNMLAGRTLMQKLKGKTKAVLTCPLLLGLDGRKMSKTFNNTINLDDSAQEMFGKIMSMKDELIVNYFELATDEPREVIEQVKKDIQAGVNPRDLKARLAKSIITMYHGLEQAQTAEEEFERVFKDKGKPTDILEVENPGKISLVDFMVENNLTDSKNNARRLIEQKAVSINNQKITDREAGVNFQAGDIIQVGKRKFLKIK